MNRAAAQTIVEDIRTLWEVATPVLVIARKLHIPERLVRRIIEAGELPQDERQPHWREH